MTEITCATCSSSPCACDSDVMLALDALDVLLTGEGGLTAWSIADINAVDAWANNIQLDIMRYRRQRSLSGADSPAAARTPVSTATEAHGETERSEET